ncbi:cation:dicarboxylate symporter family transporter [Streptomyces sp. NPDC059922]|uniref:cation:dicarboxylate symporter family transporter n=1 Tax=Streptomyces sp. NPDC059922 TaxID=3347005 RepID=UPI00364B3BF2
MLRTSLFTQVAVALLLGVLVGRVWPEAGAAVQWVSDGFIRLIKTMIAPLVFCVVVTGIAKAGDLRAFGRIGVKALVWFEVASTLALVLGLVAANLVSPGAGMNVDPATLDPDAIDAKTGGGELASTSDFVLESLPTSFVGAFAENSILQVLVLACLTGAALLHLGPKVPAILPAVAQVETVVFTLVGYVMRLAPLAVFAASAGLIGQYGLTVITTYGKLIAVCYLVGLLFLGLLAVALRLLTGISLWHFVRYTRAELLLALGTASSESVMPRMMDKLRKAGCRDDAVGLVLPTGYSFNLDGASIYLSVGTLFIAQAVGVDLSLGQQVTVVLVLMLTSKGMAGVPGSAFLALSATASSLGVIPAGAVALLLGADRIMDSMRVVVNLLGNCAAVFVVSRWDGALDLPLARRVLTAPPGASVTDRSVTDKSVTNESVTDESVTDESETRTSVTRTCEAGTSVTRTSKARTSKADKPSTAESVTTDSAGGTPDQTPADTTAGG